MLYLVIKKGKEAMKTSGFKQEIIGTAPYMKRLMKEKNGVHQLQGPHTKYAAGFICFVYSKEATGAEGVDYCGPVKTSQNNFCLAMLKNK